MKRKTEIRIKRIGSTALALGAGTLILLGIKGCSKDSKDDNYSSFNLSYGLSDANFEDRNYDVLITSLKDAINYDLIHNVSDSELKSNILNNKNISPVIQDKILDYVDTINSKFSNFNNAILNKNISLLNVLEVSPYEMIEKSGNSNKKAMFDPVRHTLYYVNGEDLDNFIYHEISNLVSECVFLENGNLVNLQFSDNGFGQGIKEQICSTFTKSLGFNDGYSDDCIYLLDDILGSDILLNSYLNGNVYDVVDALNQIDSKSDARDLINAIDSYNYNYNFDSLNRAYSLIGEYFISNEGNNLRFDYVNYLPQYVKNVCDFQGKLDSLDVSSVVISNFKTKRYDNLASITKECYPSKSKNNVILNKDPKGMNAIFSNVDSSHLCIYNYYEDSLGVDYISYIGLDKDDPSDGIFDLLSGEVVYPDIKNVETADYYIENEGVGEQKRLSVVHK